MGFDKELASYIDHTLLKPDATQKDIERVAKEAIEYQFKSVCVNPYWIPVVKEILGKSKVMPICVIGFPLGASSTASKRFETYNAIENGAEEIDMVINIGALKDKDYKFVHTDIADVVREANDVPVKVIIETCYLTEEEKIYACTIAKAAGATFVKTSTGFGTGGATIEDVKLMKKVVGEDMLVKASGGIRDEETARAMIAAGASRLGTSQSIAIVTGKKGEGNY